MSEPAFRPDRLAAIEAAEEHHPWFVARRAMVAGLVDRVRRPGPARILDVGCGTGRTLSALARDGDDPVGVDLLADHAHADGGPTGVSRADARELPFPDDTADIVLALDVLEHVVEDGVAAAELVRVARPAGHIVVTVPAHPWLWSYRDDDAGHVRRYRRAEIVDLLSGAGARVEQVAWFAGATLPLLALLRVVGRHSRRMRDVEERPSGGVAVRALSAVLHAEARGVVDGGGPPVGSSLVVVARAA